MIGVSSSLFILSLLANFKKTYPKVRQRYVNINIDLNNFLTEICIAIL